MKKIIFFLIIFFTSMKTHSEIVTKDIEYNDGNTVLQGYLAYDNSNENLRPGILIIHQWRGISDYEKMRAKQLAGEGYVAFAADIYGKDIRPSNTEEAGKEAGKYYGDLNLYRQRLITGLEELKKQKYVDAGKTAVIGYCFGGSGALELARSGADIKGAVSFHGGLKTANTEDAKKIKCRILVQHGAVDPFVPDEDVSNFKKEMENAGVDYVLTEYAGAVHSFTLASAGSDTSKGSAYNEKADKRSWRAMLEFFGEIFG
ncbi:MAG: hypothetical protein HGGPFJEG_00593 [Ignavibacteria bacterium]|nr:hypothetical protein [Ignavibacteria bacterium]